MAKVAPLFIQWFSGERRSDRIFGGPHSGKVCHLVAMSNAFNSNYPVIKRRRSYGTRNSVRPLVKRFGLPYIKRSVYPVRRYRVPRPLADTFAELKYFDTTTTSAVISNSGFVLNVSIVPLGNDVQQRIGQYITVKALSIRGIWVSNAAAQDTVRMIMFYDMSSQNAAVPAVTDVLGAALPWSALRLSNTDRFKVVFDEYAQTGPTTDQTHCFNRYKKMNMRMHFSTQSTKNQLYVLFVGTQPVNYSSTSFYCRVRFTDA